jgi:predicted metal-dependent hydrolase
MRARDALGRPVPAGSPEAVDPVPEEALPPAEALRAARELLASGRAFSAHEVLEASWKAAPPDERDLWQGLAQVCVGLTHLQRGNARGAQTLLRRAALRLADRPAQHGVDVPRVRAQALALADLVATGQTSGTVEI